MKKNLAIFGLAASASTVFAAGSLWNMKDGADLSYQVQTPEVVECTGGAPSEMDDYGAACFQSTGGWWFAYTGDTGGDIQPSAKNDDGTFKLITTSEEDGSILPDGNLIEGEGLQVTMSTTGESSEVPGVVGIGFNWTKSEDPIDISSHDGYCLAYDFQTDNDANLQMELGWDEDTNGYDSYFKTLASGAKTVDLEWGDFKKDNWDKKHSTSIETATQTSVSMKIRIKNPTAVEMSGTLTIQELGWKGECGKASSASKPTAINSAKVSAAKVLLSNRSLSIAGIASSAQVKVINLQGQVVASQTMSSASSMNLMSLEAGIYMVQVSGKAMNHSQKIILK